MGTIDDRTLFCRALLPYVLTCIFFGLCVTSSGQSAAPRKLPRTSDSQRTSAADAELEKSLFAAQEARAAGAAPAIAQANQRLIALALRELAQLRLIQSAYPQAVELYKRSIDFEDQPDTRTDLAIAELQANHPDEAIAESIRALAVDSTNARAFNIRGRAWMKKGEYAKAADALDQATRIEPDIETLYSLGICRLQTKNATDKALAAGVFEKMIQLAGDSGSLHVLFGRAYRDAGDMPAAIREFGRAIELDSSTPHAHYFLGLARLATNEWQATPEIKVEFSNELKNYPRDYLANYMGGFIASGERRYDESDRYLKVAVEVNPDRPEPWLYMGLNAYARSDMKTAEQMFRQAVKLTGSDESRANYQIRRAYVDLGRILANSGRRKESELYLSKARDLQNKTLQQGQQNVSAMAVAGGAGSAAAIVPLNPQSEMEAVSLSPENSDPFARVDASVMLRANLNDKQQEAANSQENRLRSILGLSFNDLATSEAIRGEYAMALAHYQEAERWDPAIPGLAKNLGLSAFKSNHYSEAIEALGRALGKTPADAALRAMLGMAYFGEEKYSLAAHTFSALGVRGMQDSAVGYAWASALVHTSELKEAATVLDEFEKKNSPPDQLLLVGQLWIEIGNYARAVEAFHHALRSNPALPKAHYFAGQADIRWEHWSEAGEEFQAELTLDPTDVEARYNLGFIYLQQSQVDAAINLFQQVLKMNPSHANSHYQLGKILLERGDLKGALDHLEASTRFSPQSDYMHYQLQAAYRKAERNSEADRELSIYKELKASQRSHPEAEPIQNR